MKVLTVGFYGEGDVDYRFLRPLLERIINNLLPEYVVDEIWELKPTGSRLNQFEKMRQVAAKGSGFDFIVFQLDADFSDRERGYRERFEQPYEALLTYAQTNRLNTDLIPVIPFRMTEAWLLADYEAFRDAVGTKYTAQELGFPTDPKEVEAILDPKTVFKSAFAKSRPRRRFKVTDFTAIARRINLERLDPIPAYQEFKQRLSDFANQQHY